MVTRMTRQQKRQLRALKHHYMVIMPRQEKKEIRAETRRSAVGPINRLTTNYNKL